MESKALFSVASDLLMDGWEIAACVDRSGRFSAEVDGFSVTADTFAEFQVRLRQALDAPRNLEFLEVQDREVEGERILEFQRVKILHYGPPYWRVMVETGGKVESRHVGRLLNLDADTGEMSRLWKAKQDAANAYAEFAAAHSVKFEFGSGVFDET